MLFFSLLFIPFKLKINFSRASVLAKKQFRLEVSRRFLSTGEEQIMDQKWDDFFKKQVSLLSGYISQ